MPDRPTETEHDQSDHKTHDHGFPVHNAVEGEDAGFAAFASAVNDQQKYIVFNADYFEKEWVDKNRTSGPNSFIEHTISHELFHTLEFPHPSPADDKELNQRSITELRRDLGSRLNSGSPRLGTLNTTTGIITVTYSTSAPPTLVPHGNRPTGDTAADADGAIRVENIRSLADNPEDKQNDVHKVMRDGIRAVMDEHEKNYNVHYVEVADPKNANILFYNATIPKKQNPSPSATRGATNPYNDDATIMSYKSGASGIYPVLRAGDVYTAQHHYGMPEIPAPDRGTVTAKELVRHASVLWDEKPITIHLANTKRTGELAIDMDAHPYLPAVEGQLKKGKKDAQPVRHMLAEGASIDTVDATNADITLTVNGTDGAVITTGTASSVVTTDGRRNTIHLGEGVDNITVKGHGHVLSNLQDGDSITFAEHSKVILRHWKTEDPLTTGTIIHVTGTDGDNKGKNIGSILVRGAEPTRVQEQLSNIKSTLADDPRPTIKIDALNGDNQVPEKNAVLVTFHNEKDTIITANEQSAGNAFHNTGAGTIILKMTQLQYDSTVIKKTNNYFELSYMEGEDLKKINLHKAAKIAITGTDGEIKQVLKIKDAQKELELAAALQNNHNPPTYDAGSIASLPHHIATSTQQSMT